MPPLPRAAASPRNSPSIREQKKEYQCATAISPNFSLNTICRGKEKDGCQLLHPWRRSLGQRCPSQTRKVGGLVIDSLLGHSSVINPRNS